MIVDLPDTSTGQVAATLLQLRHDVGAMAMGRVLTLIVVTDEERADGAVACANEATREHPARILVVVEGSGSAPDGLDGEIRVGGDAGASEIVVLRLRGALSTHAHSVVIPLLLPDSPIVAWWPGPTPPDDVADTPIGRMARRRITDAGTAPDPRGHLERRAMHYQAGDTDLAWTRITRWRGVLAGSLEHPPYEPVSAIQVTTGPRSPSADLMAGWLSRALQAPVTTVVEEAAEGLTAVRLARASGPVELSLDEGGVRPGGAAIATLTQPGQPERQVPLLATELPGCLAEELRRFDADEVYAEALLRGLPQIIHT